MILFRKDWLKYPGSIIDTKTKNKSFIRIAGLFKKMGVKNHAFPLALINPTLQGIDPYDPNLTEEQKVAIAIECKLNPWYFFREVFRVRNTGTDADYLKANRANIAAIWLTANHITIYLIQPRQTGKSLTGDGIDAYHLNIKATNSTLGVLTKDDKLRTRTSENVRTYIELLPKYLQLVGKKDIKNSEKVTCKALNNTFIIQVGQKDKKAADNIYRGFTLPINRIDEFAYIYNIDISLPVIMAATTAAREIAKKTNSPYYTIFTTTPGKLNTKEGQFAYEIYKSAVRWNEALYDARDEEHLNQIIDKNTKKHKVVLLEFNHRQLGFTDEWLKERILTAISNGEAAESDYLNKWVAGNMASPIPKNIIEIITKSKKNDYYPYISNHGYILKWYVSQRDLIKIKRERYLVIGVDTSDALGGKNDDIGLVIRDSQTGAVLAAGKYNETNLALFADFLVDLLLEFKNSVLIIERKSSASAILDNMFKIMEIKGLNPFKRIFNQVIHKIEEHKNIERLIHRKTVPLDILSKYKRYFGYTTSGSGEMSRNLLYGNVFRAALTYTADKVHDPDLIDQLLSLRYKNNRIDHSEDGHDDLVIGWLLSMFFLQYGRNKHYYGLKNDMVLNMVIDNELKAENPDISNEEIKKQEELKKEIEHYIKLLNNTKNETIALKLVTKIRNLQRKINTKIIRSFNIDAMLEDIKMYKKIKRLQRVA